MQIILPPLELQTEFSPFSGKIEGIKLTIQTSLDKVNVAKNIDAGIF